MMAGDPVTRSINACLAPIGNLAGCSILTASGIGNSAEGFHAIQGKLKTHVVQAVTVHRSRLQRLLRGTVALLTLAEARQRRHSALHALHAQALGRTHIECSHSSHMSPLQSEWVRSMPPR